MASWPKPLGGCFPHSAARIGRGGPRVRVGVRDRAGAAVRCNVRVAVRVRDGVRVRDRDGVRVRVGDGVRVRVGVRVRGGPEGKTLSAACPAPATVCDGGCNRMWRRLQPYVTEAATVCDGGLGEIALPAACRAVVAVPHTQWRDARGVRRW
eukprot:scaffold626_cov60-Phaeocystis_antarctica.AAC.3